MATKTSARKARPLWLWQSITAIGMLILTAASAYLIFSKDIAEAHKHHLNTTINMVEQLASNSLQLPLASGDKVLLRSFAQKILAASDAIEQVEVLDTQHYPLVTEHKGNANATGHPLSRIEKSILMDQVSNLDTVDTELSARTQPSTAKPLGSVVLWVNTEEAERTSLQHMQHASAVISATGILSLILILLGYGIVRRDFQKIHHAMRDFKAGKNSDTPSSFTLSEIESLHHDFQTLVERVTQQEEDMSSRITELDKANRDTSSALHRANTAEQAIRSMIRTGSHELRNPIGYIWAELDRLGTMINIGNREDAQQTISKCLSSISELQETLNRLFNLSKMQVDEITLDLISFKIGELFEEIDAHHERSATAKGLLLTCECSTPTWAGKTIHTDRFHLKHIITNIVDNAIKFTASGQVSIQWAIASQRDGSTLSVAVKDSGIGISPEAVASIFDEFYVGSEEGAAGWGIGLSYVRKALTALSGTIIVESHPGLGSQFHVQIPIQIEDGMAPLSQQQQLHQLSVLLVDDSKGNLDTYSYLLTEMGLEVIAFDNPFEALVSAQSMQFSFAVIDYRMPGFISGADLARKIQTISPNTYLIGVTGDTGQDVENDWNSVMDVILLKPINPTAMRRVIEAKINSTTAIADAIATIISP